MGLVNNIKVVAKLVEQTQEQRQRVYNSLKQYINEEANNEQIALSTMQTRLYFYYSLLISSAEVLNFSDASTYHLITEPFIDIVKNDFRIPVSINIDEQIITTHKFTSVLTEETYLKILTRIIYEYPEVLDIITGTFILPENQFRIGIRKPFSFSNYILSDGYAKIPEDIKTHFDKLIDSLQKQEKFKELL